MHAKFHLDPSNRLATVHELHRQDRPDRQTDRQRSDSIGRTVLQTAAQKEHVDRGLFLNKSCCSVLSSRQRLGCIVSDRDVFLEASNVQPWTWHFSL